MYVCLWFLLSAAAAPHSAVKTDLMKLVRLVSFSIIALTERKKPWINLTQRRMEKETLNLNKKQIF